MEGSPRERRGCIGLGGTALQESRSVVSSTHRRVGGSESGKAWVPSGAANGGLIHCNAKAREEAGGQTDGTWTGRRVESGRETGETGADGRMTYRTEGVGRRHNRGVTNCYRSRAIWTTF